VKCEIQNKNYALRLSTCCMKFNCTSYFIADRISDNFRIVFNSKSPLSGYFSGCLKNYNTNCYYCESLRYRRPSAVLFYAKYSFPLLYIRQVLGLLSIFIRIYGQHYCFFVIRYSTHLTLATAARMKRESLDGCSIPGIKRCRCAAAAAIRSDQLSLLSAAEQQSSI